MKRGLISALVSVSAICGLVAGCSSGGDGAVTRADSTLSIRVTDAPIDDAFKVVIDMTEFEFKPADGSAFRVPVMGGSRELNLLDFTDGASAVLIDGEAVPFGDYEWVRVYIDEATSFIQLTDTGAMYPLEIPSGPQTGFKLNTGLTVPRNSDVTYLLDFNVRRSIVERRIGPPGNLVRSFFLKPTIRVMNIAEVGGVKGIVDNTLVELNNARCVNTGGDAVYVFAGVDAELDDVADPDTDGRLPPITSDVVTLNIATGEYEYDLSYLLPGPYTIAFTCSASADNSVSDDDYPPADPPVPDTFDFDRVINVEVVSGEIKQCDIPAGTDPVAPC